MTSLKATNLISTISGVVLILLVSVFLLANAPLCAQEKKSGSKQEKQAKEDQSWDELEQWAEQAFIDQKPKEARKLWMKALLTAQDNGEELHAATTLNQLNHLFVQEKEYEKAFLALTQALEIRSRLLGKDNLLTSETMGNLALINHKLGHDLEAEELYKKALEIKDKSLGKHSPQSAITLHNLAELKSKHRQYSEAKELFERVKEIDAREYGDSHVEVVRDLISLGINSFRCHKWQESVDYF
ncbi:MAG: tetratricopeptide repeat protein, partial [Candidatus Obscuribacterales bacterium]|nr:tetratricopeptide repeat protein [Candidatus Obscuribacterales bacterium]